MFELSGETKHFKGTYTKKDASPPPFFLSTLHSFSLRCNYITLTNNTSYN